MSLTSGFYNSLNGDRKYNAEQLSSIFDGIIEDGVFASIGDVFAVTWISDVTVRIGTGRAWFNHTWMWNDSAYQLTLPASHVSLPRIDAIVIEVNHEESMRAVNFKVVQGTPSNNPLAPVMKNESKIHQYPIAYVSRAANTSVISNSDITAKVGTTLCPYVTGPLEVHDISVWVNQWQSQFNDVKSDFEEGSEALLNQFETKLNNSFSGFTTNANALLATYTSDLNANLTEYDNVFNTWFSTLQVVLDGDVAANLANEIALLEMSVNNVITNDEIDAIVDK